MAAVSFDQKVLAAKSIICDVEGTTTSISFVKDVLFPYVQKNVEEYLKTHWKEDATKTVVAALREQADEDKKDGVEGVVPIPAEDSEDIISDVVKNVEWQMSLDRKTGSLKTLQGLVWAQGYKDGSIKGHIYEDVTKAFEQWTEAGRKIYVYSSGSVDAQKLLFEHSEQGDLVKYLAGHYDTKIGGKHEKNSYEAILKNIETAAEDTVFLTDDLAEAKAAKEAGLNVVVLERPGNATLSEDDRKEYPVISSFADIPFESVEASNGASKRKIDETAQEEDEQQRPPKVVKVDANEAGSNDKEKPADAMETKSSEPSITQNGTSVSAAVITNGKPSEEGMDVDVDMADTSKEDKKTETDKSDKTEEKQTEESPKEDITTNEVSKTEKTQEHAKQEDIKKDNTDKVKDDVPAEKKKESAEVVPPPQGETKDCSKADEQLKKEEVAEKMEVDHEENSVKENVDKKEDKVVDSAKVPESNTSTKETEKPMENGKKATSKDSAVETPKEDKIDDKPNDEKVVEKTSKDQPKEKTDIEKKTDDSALDKTATKPVEDKETDEQNPKANDKDSTDGTSSKKTKDSIEPVPASETAKSDVTTVSSEESKVQEKQDEKKCSEKTDDVQKTEKMEEEANEETKGVSEKATDKIVEKPDATKVNLKTAEKPDTSAAEEAMAVDEEKPKVTAEAPKEEKKKSEDKPPSSENLKDNKDTAKVVESKNEKIDATEKMDTDTVEEVKGVEEKSTVGPVEEVAEEAKEDATKTDASAEMEKPEEKSIEKKEDKPKTEKDEAKVESTSDSKPSADASEEKKAEQEEVSTTSTDMKETTAHTNGVSEKVNGSNEARVPENGEVDANVSVTTNGASEKHDEKSDSDKENDTSSTNVEESPVADSNSAATTNGTNTDNDTTSTATSTTAADLVTELKSKKVVDVGATPPIETES